MSLVVVRAFGLVTVQDLGRRGHMHLAVPPGGALVIEDLIAANRAVSNDDHVAAIEVLGQLVVRATADVRVATDREGARQLRAGDELTIASGPRRCAYLALRGGVDAPLVLGGRGTLLCAELGKPLRAGDTIRVNASVPPISSSALASTSAISGPSSARTVETVRIIAGPDRDAFAADVIEQLTRAAYRILPSSDRVGTRLGGPALVRSSGYRDRSRPMVIGALEVPTDGQPIVLGPEHPTTGGYPIAAVIATAELGRFFAIALGGTVRFSV